MRLSRRSLLARLPGCPWFLVLFVLGVGCSSEDRAAGSLDDVFRRGEGSSQADVDSSVLADAATPAPLLPDDAGDAGAPDGPCVGDTRCDAVEVLVKSENRPIGIVAADDAIYWTNNPAGPGGDVRHLRLGESIPRTLLAASKPLLLAIDQTTLNWGSETASIERVSLTGGTSQRFVTDNGLIVGVAFAGDYIYWTATSLGAIKRRLRAGGETTVVAQGLGAPYGLAVLGDDVYWVDPNSGTVNAVRVDGSSRQILATAQGRPYGIAADSTSLYWANEVGTIMTMPRRNASSTSGNGLPQEIARGQNRPNGVALLGPHIYWVNNGNGGNGSISRTPKCCRVKQ